MAAGGQYQLHPFPSQRLGDGQPDTARAAADQGAGCSQFVHLLFLLNGGAIVVGGSEREQGEKGVGSNLGSDLAENVRTLVLCRHKALLFGSCL
ncbi:hypothetical protein VAWG001_24890 [Aeromonas dhakensis]|nr:hypothetical protein VAWG001_24890 [Aeromonas dhakensis]